MKKLLILALICLASATSVMASGGEREAVPGAGELAQLLTLQGAKDKAAGLLDCAIKPGNRAATVHGLLAGLLFAKSFNDARGQVNADVMSDEAVSFFRALGNSKVWAQFKSNFVKGLKLRAAEEGKESRAFQNIEAWVIALFAAHLGLKVCGVWPYSTAAS